MLNLLPKETKTAYRYARTNVKLRNWSVAFLVAIVGLGIIGTYGLLNIHQTTNDYNQQIATISSQLAKDKLTQTKAQVVNISSSLQLAVRVLGNEVLFSKLLTKIGSVMPNGSILTGLNINQTVGGLDLSAASTNYQTATQTQVNLNAPTNGIFSKVDIVNIDCSGQGTNNPNFPCLIQLRALFNTTNQFLFINQGGK